MLEAAYARASRQGAPLDPPLLVVLDEVANLAPLRDLDTIVSTGAGHGVQLLTVLQDLAHAHDRWGRERADTIVNNHRAKLLGAGLADERTLEWVGRLLGEEERMQRSTTRDRTGGRSISEAPSHRTLAAANVVREARNGTPMLVYGNRPPAWITCGHGFATQHCDGARKRFNPGARDGGGPAEGLRTWPESLVVRDRGDEHRLDAVEPVLGLLEDGAGRRAEDSAILGLGGTA